MLRRWKRRKLRKNEENSIFWTILVTKKFLSRKTKNGEFSVFAVLIYPPGGYVKTEKTGKFSGKRRFCWRKNLYLKKIVRFHEKFPVFGILTLPPGPQNKNNGIKIFPRLRPILNQVKKKLLTNLNQWSIHLHHLRYYSQSTTPGISH